MFLEKKENLNNFLKALEKCVADFRVNFANGSSGRLCLHSYNYNAPFVSHHKLKKAIDGEVFVTVLIAVFAQSYSVVLIAILCVSELNLKESPSLLKSWDHKKSVGWKDTLEGRGHFLEVCCPWAVQLAFLYVCYNLMYSFFSWKSVLIKNCNHIGRIFIKKVTCHF